MDSDGAPPCFDGEAVVRAHNRNAEKVRNQSREEGNSKPLSATFRALMR